jgi:hypothetical protein
MDSLRPTPLPRAAGPRLLAVLVLGVALILAGSPGRPQAQPAGGPPGGGPPKPEEELLVGFHGGLTQDEAEQVYRGHGAVMLEKIRGLQVHRVRVPGQALEAIRAALTRRGEVKFVEQNRRVSPGLTPNDQFFSSQWHLPKIGAPAAWDITQGSASAVIAILDSGVDPTHPELAAKLVPGFNFVSQSTSTRDWNGHGTAVAGAAAAIGNNTAGVAGIAWQNKIMPVVVSDSAGFAFFSTIANGVTWAADNGAKVINLSFNGMASSSTVLAAAQYAIGKGAVVVAAAGNCGCVESAAEAPALISVSATNKSDGLATFSSRGNFVDISAPGVSVITTANGGGFLQGEGTSLASPIVAGVLGLMLAANPLLTPAELQTLLLANVDDLGPTGYDTSFGHGRVNAGRAVAAAKASTPEPDTTPPTVTISSPAPDSSVSGGITVAVTAGDEVSVASVDFYLNDKYVASDPTSPHAFFVDTTKLPNGPHKLEARATDTAGNVGTSAAVNININNLADTTPPTVSITSVVRGKFDVKVGVAAADNIGVSKVELHVDGKLTQSLTTSPYTFSVKLRSLTSGSHTLEAKAFDAAGNTTVSSPASFTK